MTVEKIIEALKIAKAEVEWECPLDYAAAIDGAVGLLEKQIPKKPIVDEHGYTDGQRFYKKEICPRCREDLMKTAYCHSCGQKIEREE